MPPKAKAPSPGTESVAISIPPLVVSHVELPIVGDTPLIVHAWSHKAKEMMLAKQMKKATAGQRQAKDPDQDYIDSLYRLDAKGNLLTSEASPNGAGHRGSNNYGFPFIAFKAAAINACRGIAGLSMVEARGLFHVPDGYAVINGEPHKREDMVRLETGVADIRYRAEFSDWSTTVPVEFDPGNISLEQIVNLFNRAGFYVGVGEYRPTGRKSSGPYGRFHVELK